MRTYRITSNGYHTYLEVTAAIEKLGEYLPELEQLLAKSDNQYTCNLMQFITLVENQKDRQEPEEERTFTDEYMDDKLSITREVQETMIDEDYIESVEEVNDYMEQVKVTFDERGQRGIIEALVDAIDEFSTNYENIAEELDNTPNGLSPEDVRNILLVVENRIRINKLRAWSRIMQTPKRRK